MESFDPGVIDQGSVLGQITMLLAVVGVLLTALKNFLPKGKGGEGKSRMEILKDKVRASESDSQLTRKVNSNLSEWQLTAREAIRVLKNLAVEHGIEIPPRVKALEDHLRSIDERDIFGDSEPK